MRISLGRSSNWNTVESFISSMTRVIAVAVYILTVNQDAFHCVFVLHTSTNRMKVQENTVYA